MCSVKVNSFLLCSLFFLSSTSLTWAMNEEAERVQKNPLKLDIKKLSSSEEDGSQDSLGKRSTDDLPEFEDDVLYLPSPRGTKLASPHTPPSLGRQSPKTRLSSIENPQSQRARTGSLTSRSKTGRSSRSFIGTAHKRGLSQVDKLKRSRLEEGAFSPRVVLRSSLGGSKELVQSELDNENYKKGVQKLKEVVDAVESWAPERKKAQLEQALEKFLEAKEMRHSFAALKVGEIYTRLGILLLPEALRDPSTFLNLSQLPEGIQPQELDEALEYFKKASEEGEFIDEDLDDPYSRQGFQFQGNFEGKLYYAKFCYLIGEFYRQQMLLSNKKEEQEELKQKAKEYFRYAAAGNLVEGHLAETNLYFQNPSTDVWWLRQEDPQAPDLKKFESARKKKSKKQNLSSEEKNVLRAHALFETVRGEPSNGTYREAMQLLSDLNALKKKMNAGQIPGMFERVCTLLEEAQEDGHPLASIRLGEVRRQYGLWLLPASFRGATPPQNLMDITPLILGITTVDIDAAFSQFNLAFQCGDYLGRRWYVSLCYMKGVLHNNHNEADKAKDCFFKAAKLNNHAAQVVCLPEMKEMAGAENYLQGNKFFESAVNSHNVFHLASLNSQLADALDLLNAAKLQGFVKAERKMGEVNRHLGLLCLSMPLRNAEKLSDLKEPFGEKTALEARAYFERAMKEGDHEGTQRYAWLSTILGEFCQQRYEKSVRPKKKNAREESLDLQAAMKFFAASARLGNPTGQYAYACLLEEGKEKVKWLRKAAKGGNTAAMQDVAELLESQNIYPLEVAKWQKKLKKRVPNANMGPLAGIRLGYAKAEYSNAMKLINKADFKEATGLLSHFSKDGHIPSSYALMYCYGQLEQEENLRTVYESLADQGEEEGLCLYAKQLEAEDPTRAKAYYIEAIQSHYPLAFFDFAQFLANQKRFREAITFFRELTHHIEAYAIKAHELLIGFFERQKKPAEAQQWREGLSSLRSDQVIEYLGSFEEPSEDELGASEMEIMFKLPPLCFYDMQRMFLKKNDEKKGIFYFRKFLNSLREFSALAHYNLGLLNESQRTVGVALSDFETSAKLGSSEALFIRALYYAQEGKRKTAKDWLERVIKQEEEEIKKTGEVGDVLQEAALELAFMAQEEENHKTAEKWYRFILEKDPKSTRALINLGLLLHILNPIEEEQLFTKAANLNDSKALSLLGDIYVQRGDIPKGKTYYVKAAELGRASAAFKLARLTKDHNEALFWDGRAAQFGKLEAMINVSEYNHSLGNGELANEWEDKALQQRGGKKKFGLSLIKRKDKESRVRGYDMLILADPKRRDPEVSYAIAEYKIAEGDSVQGELRVLIELTTQEEYIPAVQKLYQIALDLVSEDLQEKSPHLSVAYEGRYRDQALFIFKTIADDIKVTPRDISEDALFQCGLLLQSIDTVQSRRYLGRAVERGHKGAQSHLEKMQ